MTSSNGLMLPIEPYIDRSSAKLKARTSSLSMAHPCQWRKAEEPKRAATVSETTGSPEAAPDWVSWPLQCILHVGKTCGSASTCISERRCRWTVVGVVQVLLRRLPKVRCRSIWRRRVAHRLCPKCLDRFVGLGVAAPW